MIGQRGRGAFAVEKQILVRWMALKRVFVFGPHWSRWARGTYLRLAKLITRPSNSNSQLLTSGTTLTLPLA